jgi:hypothetical protein
VTAGKRDKTGHDNNSKYDQNETIRNIPIYSQFSGGHGVTALPCCAVVLSHLTKNDP